MYQPRHYDCPGWIYVYYRKLEEDLVKQGKQSHILLYKVGRTKNLPHKRVQMQADKNKEIYKIRETFGSLYCMYLEFMIHLYFDKQRVVRPDLKDGKTEWFLVCFEQLRDAITKIKLFLIRQFKDCGWEKLPSNEVETA